MKGEDGRSAATLFKDGDTNSQTLTVNTDSRGKATVYVRSKLAKQGVVTATMNNGNYKSGQVDFIADAATAQISALDIIKNKALADGQSSNKLQVTVKDINGNPLAKSQDDLSASNGATIVNGSTVMTDAEGQAILLVTNTTIGDSTITARINGSSKTQVVTFVADKLTTEGIGTYRYKVKQKEPVFELLLITGILSIVFDGATAYTVNYLDKVPGLVNAVLHACFLCGLDTLSFVIFLYMYDITRGVPKSRKIKTLIILPLAICIAVVILFKPQLEYRSG